MNFEIGERVRLRNYPEWEGTVLGMNAHGEIRVDWEAPNGEYNIECPYHEEFLGKVTS